MRGIVKRYSDFNGYGFIRSDTIDYFVHVSQIEMDGFKTLSIGQETEFEPYNSQRGWQAKNVQPIQNNELPQTPVRILLKRNPFTPQDPVVNPSKFAGRRIPFSNAVDALFNNKNILISGHRGIGKSSVAYQLLYLTQGERALLDRLNIDIGDYEFNYIAGDHRCVPGNTLPEIVNGLVYTLLSRLGQDSRIKESKSSWGFDFKFLKVSMETTTSPISPGELTTQFVAEIRYILENIDFLCNGICFLIDEVDVLDKVEIAPFLKAVVEKFRLDGLDNISFIISGVTGITTTLITQHPSSTRLLEILELERMSDEELGEVIDITLDGTGVSMKPGAKEKILSISNRFPQPVHLLGYQSFRIDSDDSIDTDDIEIAKDFIVRNLRRQEFDDKLQQLGRGVIAEILKVFASSKYETIELSYITNRLPYSYDEILGNLGRLEQRGIIEKQYRGVYRFREPLFKIYLQWVLGINDGYKG